MTKPYVIIDAGHGGKDPGASGNGIIEKEFTLKISLYQAERFRQLGVPFALTRENDTFLDSTPRANLVKNSGAKYCISNHINAGGGEGVETIHSIHARPDLAKAIADSLSAAGQKFRRVFSRQGKSGDYYYMHRQTGAVSTVIVEYGFVDNAADAERVKANWQAYAEAAVAGFCSFAGIPYKPPAADPVPDELPKVGNLVNVVINGQQIAGGVYH